jgi:hypothetical protein
MDTAASLLMGFDPDKIRLIKNGLEDKEKKSPLFFGKKEDIKVIDNGTVKTLERFGDERNLHYKPHAAWSGQIERSK